MSINVSKGYKLLLLAMITIAVYAEQRRYVQLLSVHAVYAIAIGAG